MATILVFVEHKNGKIKKSSAELLSAAKRSGATVLAAAFGPDSKNLAGELGGLGVSTAFVCEDSSLKDYTPQAYSLLLSNIIKEKKPAIVLASATLTGK